jgi:hypothetical protein
MSLDQPEKDVLLATNLATHPVFPSSQDNLAVFFSNILLYCKLQTRDLIDRPTQNKLKDKLKEQLNELWFETQLGSFKEDYQLEAMEGEE